ncbi:hypothetical protein [Primorskyibacter sp. S87]|uniref:hypothetical protein n=1 Tax=Primorskyibacter sp. S87 TaxID=3415126 RepID=UPI003C7C44C4
MVGQPLVLRMKVLVPTYMPAPPVYPTIEQPNLLVRLPNRATSPVSETVDGETWSGTSRGYRLYPLAAGAFEIPGQTVTITYADPDTNAPVTVEVPFDPIRLTATVPPGAEELSPLIVASGFSLSQEFEGGPDLAAGEPVTRSVTARIEGTTAILIPSLLPAPEGDALRAYPEEPKVNENENRGTLSGSRSESATYLAQAGGTASLPPISFDWFNLETGEVETAQVEGMNLTLQAPPVQKDPGQTLRRLGVLAIVILVLAGLIWRLREPISRLLLTIRQRWLNSEHHAARQVRSALARKDLSLTYSTFENWRDRVGPMPDRSQEDAFMAALLTVGSMNYADTASSSDRPATGWSKATRAFADLRKAARTQNTAKPGLPPLNP